MAIKDPVKKKEAQKRADAKRAGTRFRNWATVVYPESAPSDWLETLGTMCVPAMVSPLHDKDKNPTGEPKKEHFHVLLLLDNPITANAAKEIFDKIGGVGCERVQSIRGYARYLCHLDNPEKAQYAPEAVTCFGGADFIDTIGIATDRYKAIDEMMDWCESNGVTLYSVLMRYARQERRDWFRVLCDNGTFVMKEYLKTLAHEWELAIRETSSRQ